MRQVCCGVDIDKYQEDQRANEVGAAYGLCNAYCEGMDCDGNYPAASQQAFDRVEANYWYKVEGVRPTAEELTGKSISGIPSAEDHR